MQKDFTEKNAELLGVIPVAAIITGAVNLGTTIAGSVVQKRQQERAIKAQKELSAAELKLAEITGKTKAYVSDNSLQIAALAGIPLIALIIIMKKRQKSKGKKKK